MWRIYKADITSFIKNILPVAFFWREAEGCSFIIEMVRYIYGFTESYSINEDNIILDQKIEKSLMVMASNIIGIALMGKSSTVQKDDKDN